MEQQQKPTAMDKLIQAISILTDQQHSIMMNGAIQPQLWDAIMQPEVLASPFPTTVLAKALVAQFRWGRCPHLYTVNMNKDCETLLKF